MKVMRKIVRIDEEKCNGCGLCIDACAEGAIQLVDGKAKLVSDTYCDGLGACLGDCPQDAITIEEREADPFDEEAVEAHLASQGKEPADAPPAHGGCPGMATLSFGGARAAASKSAETGSASELSQWPVQLHLLSPKAPYWQGADLLIAADCVAFAYADFHADLLRGRKLVIACPKLDETSNYVAKLAAIFAGNDIRSITVAHMEVPCCTGIIRIASAALAQSGKDIPFSTVEIGIRGNRKS